ncbi:MAG TPA: hypothetical protein VLD19_07060, partial [Chitinophagaceae bacterium]|nr:hypothetical protein [Chitinophagaceae bacterium]
SMGNTADDGNKLQVTGNTSFYHPYATGNAGGIVIKQASANTGGYGVMEIAGTSSSWTPGAGFQFLNHIPEVRIGATLYAAGNLGAKTGWFGTDEVAGVGNTLLLTADATNAYITSMKYASSPYPDTYISAPDIYFNTKAAAWPDGQNGVAYGTTRMAITQGGNIGIGTLTPTANLQITSPTIANRDAGPFQFAISDATRDRFYVVHDVSATSAVLYGPNGSSRNSVEGSDNGMTINSDLGISLSCGGNVLLNGGYHIFQLNGTDFARMSPSGFGIGTNSPSAQLHTTGTVRFAGLNNDNSQGRLIVSDVNGNLSYRDAATISGGTAGWGFNGSSVGVQKT